MGSTITLKDYLEKNKTFVIPDYQRGYIWGKKSDKKNSVENLMEDLLLRYKRGESIFLQGVTISETPETIILIDGQQRTTCLYLLLKILDYQGPFEIRYEVRETSGKYLKDIDLNDVEEDPEEEYQDIYFFKKTVRIIREKLKDIDKKSFLEYLLNNIKFLYINIPLSQASKVFTMMNGNKAEMLPEEIIKAEILRLASLNNNQKIDYKKEFEQNMLRNRYAREWDKWLHWWNQKNVQTLYGCNNTMGLLISSFLHLKKKGNLSFEKFKNEYLLRETSQEAKQTFDGLRRLQKRFEDAFNDPSKHNMIGAILCIFNEENKRKFLDYYFVKDNREDLETYYKLVFLGMTHDEIDKRNSERFIEKYDQTFKALNDDYLYLGENKEIAFITLLRLNVDQDILQQRFFNFNIWKERSLEHIMPKSKVGHQDSITGEWKDGNDQLSHQNSFALIRRDIKATDSCGNEIKTTEHSIGNLVLLYKNENSQFNNSDFLAKKEMFFSPLKKGLFKSRHLLHTICVFAEKESWDGPSIAINKIKTISKFENDYAALKKEFKYEEQN